MLLLAEHLSPWISLPIAAACMAGVVWYWRRLGGSDVPESRRRIRRISMAVMLVAIIAAARAVSFVDHVTDPRNYAVAWAITITLVLLVIFTAFLDVLNNMRIHREELADAIRESRERLRNAATDAREQRAADERG